MVRERKGEKSASSGLRTNQETPELSVGYERFETLMAGDFPCQKWKKTLLALMLMNSYCGPSGVQWNCLSPTCSGHRCFFFGYDDGRFQLSNHHGCTFSESHCINQKFGDWSWVDFPYVQHHGGRQWGSRGSPCLSKVIVMLCPIKWLDMVGQYSWKPNIFSIEKHKYRGVPASSYLFNGRTRWGGSKCQW